MVRSHSDEPAPTGGGITDDGPDAAERALARKWNYTTGIKLYHQHNNLVPGVSHPMVNGRDVAGPLPGMLCKSARELLGLSQLEFSGLSGVSRKTINDYENLKATPGARILRAVREALEGKGARFFDLGDAIGVVVTREGIPIPLGESDPDDGEAQP